jgi:hypothetical protein
MSYSLKQAAKATGKTRPTILRAIQANKISAKKDEQGAWQIEPVELHRIYPPVQEHEPTQERRNDTYNEAYEIEIRLLRERVADKEAVIDDLREDRDRWRTQAEKMLLTDQREKAVITPSPETPATAPAKRRWWQRGRRA